MADDDRPYCTLQTSSQSRTYWLPSTTINQACKEATSLHLSSELLYLPLFLLGLLLLHLQAIGHAAGLSAHLLNEPANFVILLPTEPLTCCACSHAPAQQLKLCRPLKEGHFHERWTQAQLYITQATKA